MSPPRAADYEQAPYLVLWELTRACQLVCTHCRACAQPDRDRDELSTEEGKALLRHLHDAAGERLVVLTGGDPLERPDLEELVAYGAELGHRMTLTPSVTPLLTEARLDSLTKVGIRRFALSLDGARAETHDGFRGVAGTFARTVAVARYLRDRGRELQLNSCLHPGVHAELDALHALVGAISPALWSVFVLVATGRAEGTRAEDAATHERIYRWLSRRADESAFPIKTTAGQPYYRVRAQRGRLPRAGLRAPNPVNDGKGVVFVSHRGEVKPSGFLSIVCGNVREAPLLDIYRHHPLFQALRTPAQLGGKCGVCEYRDDCGGSRARAWSLTGDPLAEDPTCAYRPRALRERAKLPSPSSDAA